MQLTAMIFGFDADTQARLQRRCVMVGDVNLFHGPDVRPSNSDMVRLINAYSPELVFVEFQDREDAVRTEEYLRVSCPKVALVGFADHWPHEMLLRVPGRYVRVISTSIGMHEFKDVVLGAVNTGKPSGPDNVIVFIPAKAGSGASTVALNVTGALASKCGKSTILIEGDLHSGPAGMYLNLNPTHSVVDALNHSHNLDEHWGELMAPVENFAVLPACNIRGPIPQISSWGYRRLISYTRQRYEFVIFDLPEVVNPATEAIVTNAKAVYVVCTPEVPSLLLARKRTAALMERGVPEEKLQIVLNRYSKYGPEPSAIAEVLGFPIAQLIPNDYKSLWEANLKRRLVDDKTAAGKAFERFARSLCGEAPETKSKNRLFGLFSAA
jgi:pilus assembly protein CpaE